MADPCSRTWPGARSLSKHWFERRESRCVRYTPLSAGVTDTPAKVQDNSVAQGHTSPTGLSNPLICWRNSRWRTWRRDCILRATPLSRGRIVVRRVKSRRSEEHTSDLQSLMRISYAVFCLKKKKY